MQTDLYEENLTDEKKRSKKIKFINVNPELNEFLFLLNIEHFIHPLYGSKVIILTLISTSIISFLNKQIEEKL